MVALPARAQAPLPPFEGYVSDGAGVLTAVAKQRLETTLRAFEARTGSQVAALIVPSTLPETMPEYARRVAIERAKTRTKPDDGAILVVAMDKGAVHLEVGPALAETLTPRNAAVITSGTLPPAFHGSASDGIEFALRIVMQTIDSGPDTRLSTFTLRAPANPAMERVASVTKFLGIAVLLLAAIAAAGYALRRYGAVHDPRGAGTWPTQPTAPSEAPARKWPHAAAIIAINLVPLWGVLVLGWSVFALFLLFWLENIVIILFIGALRMLFAVPRHPAEWLLKPIEIPFRLLPLAMFSVVHGIFIFVLFARDEFNRLPRNPLELLPQVMDLIERLGLLPAIAAIAAAHLLLFLWSYILGGEWRRPSSGKVDHGMGRLVMLHMTIILGGFVTVASGSPLFALVILVGLKIAGELLAHFGLAQLVGRSASRPR